MKKILPPVALALALAASLALAPAGPAAEPDGGLPPLEREELRRCIGGEAQQREREAAHEARVAAHRATLGLIADEAGRLQADRRALDRSQPGATAAFNARLDAHEARLARYNAESQAINESAAALRESRTGLHAACDGRAHSLTHEAQIRGTAAAPVRPADPSR